MSLSVKQKQIVKTATDDCPVVFSGGAVRSGKTFANNLAFATWELKHGMMHDSVVIGQSIESIMRNMGFDLIDVFKVLGAHAELNRTLGTRIIVNHAGQNASIWVIGASDQRGKSRIQGATLKGMLIDEVALLDKEFFDMSFSRLSVPGSKMWGTYNPGSPHHWFKRDVIDRLEGIGGVNYHFTFEDNPDLSEEYKARIMAAYSGHTYRRLVLGEWAAASGLIFPDATNIPDKWEDLSGEWHLALDYGVSGVFAALAIKEDRRRSVVVGEHYYDARETGYPRTEEEHLASLLSWASAYGIQGCRVWMDPNTPASFKRLLRQKGFVPRNADNDVIPGLTLTASRLKTGNVVLCTGLTKLQEEMANYLWDEQSETDKPIKKADHLCDALRYYCFTTGKSLGVLSRPLRAKELLP